MRAGAGPKSSNFRGTILVIDDDAVQRAGLTELFSLRGYDVVVACDGQDGLELLRDGLRPTLIVLDLAMPRMDGWSFLGLLRGSDRSTVPVLVMSGEAGRAPEGADAWLEKPLDAAVLGAVVARLIAGAAVRDEGERAHTESERAHAESMPAGVP